MEAGVDFPRHRPRLRRAVPGDAGGTVKNGERAPGQTESRIEWLDTETLAWDPKTIEGVAERRRVEPGCALYVNSGRHL
jgi:hypothetical protein